MSQLKCKDNLIPCEIFDFSLFLVEQSRAFPIKLGFEDGKLRLNFDGKSMGLLGSLISRTRPQIDSKPRAFDPACVFTYGLRLLLRRSDHYISSYKQKGEQPR